MPITVVAAQYSPRPAGTTTTNQANIAGSIHCIIVFICFCWSLWATFRAVEMRCWIHIAANTTTISVMLVTLYPEAPRSMKRNFVLSGMAPCSSSKS